MAIYKGKQLIGMTIGTNKVDRAGDTMTGDLILEQNLVLDNRAKIRYNRDDKSIDFIFI